MIDRIINKETGLYNLFSPMVLVQRTCDYSLVYSTTQGPITGVGKVARETEHLTYLLKGKVVSKKQYTPVLLKELGNVF
jgi:hypothetical protein